MTEQNANQSIPDEVQESLRTCGGIEGLGGLIRDDEALREKASVHRALADPLRLKILILLTVRPLCVCVIRAVLGIADSKLSYHLAVLKTAGFVTGEKQGTWIIYRITEKGRRWLGMDA
jgi:DNA-binding transcriptional ArsR family regulator